MPRIAYVNGRYAPYAEACVHVEDRGFQFADSVYEVIEVHRGALVDEPWHLDRLDRSLAALAIPAPVARGALAHVMREVMRRNSVADGVVYVQVTRGVAARDFLPPEPGRGSTLVCLARSSDPAKIEAMAAAGVSVITRPEVRWARCDIKTTMLLPAVLAKREAAAAGAREVWFVDRDGFVVEGASSTAWIVDEAGRLVTRPPGPELLPGVTRASVMDVAATLGFAVIERPFTVSEARHAREAFNTAASATVMPVVRIDGATIGNGRPGTIALGLRAAFHRLTRSGAAGR